MGNNKTILICLNYFQIGGVETFVYNQAIALIKKGYNVILLGKDGIYSDKFYSTGAKCIEFEFENKIYYDYEKIESFIKILKKYNVTEVYNNSFQSMNVVMPACLLTNTPYVVYSHMSESVIEDEFKFFEDHYETYKDNFELYYRYAERIIAITPKSKEVIEKKFNIDDKDKVIYMRNSIDFDKYKPEREVKEIKNILIISRLEELKYKSVIDGVRLFKLLSKDKSIKLTIAGDGAKRADIEEYVKKNKIKNVKFIGGISNVKEEMERNDLIIGVGRCILEAIAMKRIAIISGYTGMRDILSKDNYDIELNDNFAGKHLEVNDVKRIAEKINNMTEENIKEVVEYNYNRAKKDLDINNNLYTIEETKCNYESNYKDIIDYMIKINFTIGKLAEQRFDKMENDWKEHLKYKEWMEGQLNQAVKASEDEIERLSNELKKYNNLKIIRLAKRLKRVINLKGNKNE